MLRQERKKKKNKMRNNIIVSDHMNTPRMVWRDEKNVYFT